MRFASFLLLLFVIELPLAALAQESVRIDLPEGEIAIDVAWRGSDEVVLLIQTSTGYALRAAGLQDGSLRVIAVPKSFMLFEPGPDVTLTLAPGGNSLAVMEYAKLSLKPDRLKVYKISRNQMDEVSTESIPAGFWPQFMCWNTPGNGLYISARPYLFPEQQYSIGRLDMTTGKFQGAVSRSNFDLIEELAFAHVRNGLVLKCRGYRGEYPDASIIGLVDLTNMQSSVLHASGASCSINSLLDGEVFVIDSDRRESWVLPVHSGKLQPIRLSTGAHLTNLRSSADGSWYGFLASGAQLGLTGVDTGQYLALKNSKGTLSAVDRAAAGFSFSPESSHVAVVLDGGREIELFPLEHAN